MGGAQPLAITMNEGVGLIVEVDAWRAERRLKLEQVDRMTADLDEALQWIDAALAAGAPLSVGLVGNAADVLPELVRRNRIPDVVTDQTSAHDPLRYYPRGMSFDEAVALREQDPESFKRQAMESMAVHVQAMLDFQARGSVVFDYGNNIRQRAFDMGGQERL